MKKYLVLLSVMLSFSLPAFPQSEQRATLTIYSPDVSMKGYLSRGGGGKHSPWPFGLHIYVDDSPIAYLSNAHFLTFSIPAGSHAIGGSWKKRYSETDNGRKFKLKRVSFRFEQGVHYYLRFATYHTGWGGFAKFTFSVEEVPCADAAQETSTLQPVAPKDIQEARPSVVPSMYFPACESQPAVDATAKREGGTSAPELDSGTSKLKNGDVISMVNAGLSTDVILAKLAASNCSFDTTPDGLRQLKAAGVPDSIVIEMLRVSR